MTDAMMLQYVVKPFTSKVIDMTLGRYQVLECDHRHIPEFVTMCRAEIEALLLAFSKVDVRAIAASRSHASAAKDARGKQQAPRNSGGVSSPEAPHNKEDQTDTLDILELANAASAAGSTTTQHAAQSDQAAGDASPGEPSDSKALLEKYDRLLTSELFLRSTLVELLEVVKSRELKVDTLTGHLNKRNREIVDQRRAYFREMRHLREMIREYKDKGKCDLHDISLFNWEDDKSAASAKDDMEVKIQEAVEEVKKQLEYEKDKAQERMLRATEEMQFKLRTADMQISSLTSQMNTLKSENADLSEKLADALAAQTSENNAGVDDAAANTATAKCDVSTITDAVKISTFSNAKRQSISAAPIDVLVETNDVHTQTLINASIFPSNSNKSSVIDDARLMAQFQRATPACSPIHSALTPPTQQSSEPKPPPTLPTPPVLSLDVPAPDVAPTDIAVPASTHSPKSPRKAPGKKPAGKPGSSPAPGITISTTTSTPVEKLHVTEHEDKDLQSGWAESPRGAIHSGSNGEDDSESLDALQSNLRTANETISQLRGENQRLRELSSGTGSRPSSAKNGPQSAGVTGGAQQAAVHPNATEQNRHDMAQLKRVREDLRQKNELLAQRQSELDQLRLEMDRWFSQYSATVPKGTLAVSLNTNLIQALKDSVLKAERSEEEYRVLSWKLLRSGIRYGNVLKHQMDETTHARTNDLNSVVFQLEKEFNILDRVVRQKLMSLHEQRLAARHCANASWDKVLLHARTLCTDSGDVAVPPTPRYYNQAHEGDLRPVEVFAAPGNSGYFKAVSQAACAYSVEQVLSLYTQDHRTGHVTPRPSTASHEPITRATFTEKLKHDIRGRLGGPTPLPGSFNESHDGHAMQPPATQSSQPWEAPSLGHTPTRIAVSRPASAKPMSALRHMQPTPQKPHFNPSALTGLSKQQRRVEVVSALRHSEDAARNSKMAGARETYNARVTCGSAHPELSEEGSGLRTTKLVGRHQV